MPEDENRRIWLVIDELASLEKLASLESALTKGRKNGLRIVAGLQSVSQLDTLYGTHEAQTIRACFRNLVVLGGSTTDPKTCEEMSKSIGEHEVERDKTSRTSGMRRGSTNEAKERSKERIVLSTEIASLPPLTGYVSFAGDYPIARVKLEPESFPNNVMSFVENTSVA
jgi:type IV secretory pathway TraG/TraD family ATPase VirD4